MRNRFGVVGVIALVALLVGAVSPAFGSSDRGAGSASSEDSGGRTIRAIFLPTDFAEIDNGTQGPSLDDEVVFSGPLLRGGEQVGRASVICTFVFVTADREEAQCPGTAELPGGQITVGGVIVNRALSFTLPITGGSGQYQGASGQLISRDESTATQPKLVFIFHLVED
jgi:hypothetical protein